MTQLTPKKFENVVINTIRVQAVAVEVLSQLDAVEPGKFDDFKNGEILTNVATIRFHGVNQFDRILTLAVYENGTFQIMSSSTVLGVDALEAYGRALAFIKALELVNGRT